ncbi:hypothetical protein CFC21_107852, partial [Triticum aestivum]
MASLSLEDVRNETVDLSTVTVDEVFKTLKCDKKGLSEAEGENRLKLFGPNKLEEKKESKLLKFLGFMWNPLSWVMEIAAIIAIALANGGGRPPDWQDFVGIVTLLFINSTISYIEEANAGDAAAALMAGLAPKTKLLRDGSWEERDAAILVPGDIISIKLGDIIPADARLLEGDALKIDQSALTGESMPVNKYAGQEVFSGSTVKQGELEAVVIATGVHTFFGKAAHLVDSTNNVGHFQQVLTAIGNFCIISIAAGMLVEIIVMYPIQHRAYRDGIDNLLVLLIGGIPIAMPTVLSVTMAIGSHRLSQQGAITKRMTAIEEMAGMDVLCSDKTGTLTLNKLTVDKTLIEVCSKGVDKDMVLLYAARASRVENQDAIDTCIVNMLADPKEARAGIKEVHFLPFNPVDKRTAITYIDGNGDWHRVSKGAPEQIIELCKMSPDAEKKVHTLIASYADRGLRSLGVSYQQVPEKNKESAGDPWQFIGLLPLFDPPRHDSAETIRRALHLGVNVKMITGDQLAIGKETGRRLGMGTNMYPSTALLGDKSTAVDGPPHRRADREGGRVRGGVPGAQVRDREAAAGQEAHRGDDGRRRERRAGAEEGGHRDRGGRRDGRGAVGVGHRADGARAERDRERGADEPRHLPADEELHHLRGVHHDPYRARVHAGGADLEVRLRALHGAHHRHPQRRHHHDHLQGPGEAVAQAGLVEAGRDLRDRGGAGHLHGAGHRGLLLPGARHGLLHGDVRGAPDPGQRPAAHGGAVPAGEHHQ